MERPNAMLDPLAQTMQAIRLARDEVEIISPRNLGRKAYDLLRTYHIREWHDERGAWHVVISASRITEIEQAVIEHRSEGHETDI